MANAFIIGNAHCRRFYGRALIVLLTLFFISACATYKRIQGDIYHGAELHRTLCIAPFTRGDVWLYHPALAPVMPRLVRVFTEECPALRLVHPGQEGYPDRLRELPRLKNGEIDNFAIAQIGRQNGYAAVMTGTAGDILQNTSEKEAGWFSGNGRRQQIRITVSLYDPQTAAKLFEKSFLEEMDVRRPNAADTRPSAPDRDAVETALQRLMPRISRDICSCLADVPWVGYVTAVDEKTIIVSAGRLSGLKTGDVLEVYAGGGVMAGTEGRRYFLQGPHKARIKLTSVFSFDSRALRVQGEMPAVGDTVHARR